ncbi:MAG: HNH endonuclease signature motif containing protein, partial [Acidimicrobiia bacterium]
GTCRFPGCTHRGWLDAHHQHHWADGGPTNLDNLLLLCRHHHRTVHEGGWTVHRNNDNDGDRGGDGGGGGGWTFTNPNGWSPQQPPTTEPHDIELGLPDDLDPHAVRPYWIDRPHYPYIISVFADPPPPDPQWN